MTSIELRNFVTVVLNALDVVEVRRIHASAPARKAWCLAGELPGYAEALLTESEAGFNIFAGVNPRRERGASGNAAVPLARTYFADFDGASIVDAIRRIEAVKMPYPTMIVWSGHGFHFYWRLSTPNTDLAGWSERQKDLAALLGSDPKVCNAERIMRLPGFFNRKREPHVLAEIVDSTRHCYHPADLPIPLRPGSDDVPPVFTTKTSGDQAYKFGDQVARCRNYLLKVPNAISGTGGHKATWYAANICNRFGLGKDQATDLMHWYSRTKCDPPWNEKEILHKVSDAYGRNAGQHGAKVRSA